MFNPASDKILCDRLNKLFLKRVQEQIIDLREMRPDDYEVKYDYDQRDFLAKLMKMTDSYLKYKAGKSKR